MFVYPSFQCPPDVSNSGSKLHLRGSPSLAHLIRGAAQSIPHPTDKNRTLWDARDDIGPYTGPPGVDVELGADLQAAMDLRASTDADEKSIGVSALGSGSDYTVFLQRIGVCMQSSDPLASRSPQRAL
jgi:N-acetylated-alpha-linked acidic dipeptidase